MPAIWASSERPLFVRTVWVNGIRHAVLSSDDPVVNPRLRPRPRTSTEKSFIAKHQHADTRLDRLNNCFTNLHVVVEKNFPDDKIPPRVARRQSAPPCPRMCSEKTGGLLEIYVNDIDKLDVDRENGGAFEKRESTSDTCVFDRNSDVEQSLRLQRDAFSTMTERKQTDRSSDAQGNPLSERVLQWLDLSGRAQDYELEVNSERSPKVKEDRRWKAVRRRRHPSQTRESSGYAERESSRVVVQNYRLQKNCKLEALAKAAEAKVAQKRLSKMKDTTGDEERKEESEAKPKAAEEELKNEDESRNDLMAVWSPPGRLQLHIVMPSFSSDGEKRASSLESLVCD